MRGTRRSRFAGITGASIARAIAAAAILAAAGCGKPVLRVADASLGDYYTEKEFKKLREEQRLEYCESLAEQDSIYREEIADAKQAAERFARRAAAARAAADSLSRAADSLVALAASGAAPSRPPQGAPAPRRDDAPGTAPVARVIVRDGDSLWRISARGDVWGDGRRWTELYEANRDRIRDADRIYPGQELTVPR
ncbi:MAG TPA: LysM peptidoglycan-binding domain-containing protein [Candidatus Eisenbacteria bacterium]|nr:LysM peptidoglycan-binding domain-containing protein [Candidatus Eisenbacteria bacterium]